MHLTLVDYVLWILPVFLLAGIVVAMYRRGVHRSYPYFFAYTICQVVSEVILFGVSRVSYVAYYYGYYVDLILGCILSAAILWNVIRRVFVRRPLRPSTSVFLYLCAGIALIALVGFATNVSKSPNSGAAKDALFLFNRTVSIAQVLLAAAIILVGRRFAISRKSFVFGLVFGFGMFALVNTLVFTSLSRHGALSPITLSRINSLTYALACMVWLCYSIFGEKDCQRFEGSEFAELTFRGIRKSVVRNRWFFRTAVGNAGLDR